MFVYNLGTMFYIDDVLYSNYLLGNPPLTTTTTPAATTTATTPRGSTTMASKGSTAADAELVPKGITEQDDDFLLDDDEIITPRALPVLVNVVGAKQEN